MNPKFDAILIARPDWFRESIQTLLASIPGIREVHPVESVSGALELVESVTPCLIILDFRAIDHELSAELSRIREIWKMGYQIILVDDKDECQQAKALGAGLALLKGFTALKFINEIEKILGNQPD
ncbi:MAG: response regulator transcription factor [Chloroflexi bacterium]|nr:response regulator transcription factor [Chloroflexota bacterium]